MLRIVIFFVIAAALTFGVVVFGGQTSIGINAARLPAQSYGLWALGLAMGLMCAWLARFDWPAIFAHFRRWFAVQRQRAELMTFGLVCLGVLMFY